ncbi:DUF3131 domain-containing protein [Alisedimentitalea sp. MJ-SS2]|uniref:DUF3131 domain-containing protein n=1 Tax=Aliisedimentitalea sp. MJ-SS2 TaxID=3049795 RepID=UPI002909F4A2|nr:DUF3131 domain-containing protein [Alisedimentitalea sp. MJ-SS2]MDU8929825.1 DUF3131 domain-containing protein [Alisedimentitalea sp. MJ-SS2]
MKRRSFLKSAAATGLFAAGSGYPVQASPVITSTSIVLTDISADTDPVFLGAFAANLAEFGIPITCVLDQRDAAAGKQELMRSVQALVQIGGGVEFALNIPELSTMTPYFQSRAIFEAKKALAKILTPQNLPGTIQTVLCHETEAPTNPAGVRAAGVFSVVVLPKSERPVRSEAWQDASVRFSGGYRISPRKEFVFDRDMVGSENKLIYFVSARDVSAASEGQLLGWSTRLGQALAQREAAGQLALMPLPDMRLRDNFVNERLVSVLIDLPETPTDAERRAVSDLSERLAQTGIPVTTKHAGTHFWSSMQDGVETLSPITTTCKPGHPVGLSARTEIKPGFGLQLVSDDPHLSGVEGCGFLKLSVTEVRSDTAAGELSERIAQKRDKVILIRTDQISTPVARRRIQVALSDLRHDAVTRYVGLHDMVAQMHSNGPVETRHRLTRAAIAGSAAKAAAKPAQNLHPQLLEDAKHAWSFIEKYTNRTTGLCPATVNQGAGGSIHEAVTMWDVGSNINAIAAAAELGLIDKKQAIKRMKRILPNITGRRTENRLLPQGWIRTDRFHWGDWTFDGCDAGRLLSALDVFRRRVGLEKELEKQVAAWEFDKVITNRELHSFKERKLITTYNSHCAHYLALAFRRWGYDIVSPYETFTGGSPADGEVALLETVAAIGPLGAEPLLLEAIELGMSPESSYLADVLYYAQEEEYHDTGRLVCVSETPIDQKPWFIYQGLQLGAGPRAWRLDTVGHEPQYLTAEAADKLLSFSTKAAYLWAAYKPGALSEKLLARARATARNKTGFASSINLKANKTSTNYTDLNTNSVILQAVAHSLHGTG